MKREYFDNVLAVLNRDNRTDSEIALLVDLECDPEQNFLKEDAVRFFLSEEICDEFEDYSALKFRAAIILNDCAVAQKEIERFDPLASQAFGERELADCVVTHPLLNPCQVSFLKDYDNGEYSHLLRARDAAGLRREVKQCGDTFVGIALQVMSPLTHRDFDVLLHNVRPQAYNPTVIEDRNVPSLKEVSDKIEKASRTLGLVAKMSDELLACMKEGLEAESDETSSPNP